MLQFLFSAFIYPGMTRVEPSATSSKEFQLDLMPLYTFMFHFVCLQHIKYTLAGTLHNGNPGNSCAQHKKGQYVTMSRYFIFFPQSYIA